MSTTQVASAGRSPGDGPPERRQSVARARILATATRLFYTTGIRAVGVDRIIKEAGVARMTFFRHFPSKDDLVVAFLESRADAARTELGQIRRQRRGARSVLAAVAAGVTTVPTTDGFRGCEFINTAAEFCDPAHPARIVIAQHRAWIRDLLSDALAELDHPAPQRTAELLLMLRTGAIVAASLEGISADDEAFDNTWWAMIDRT